MTALGSLHASTLSIPFKASFRHASAERSSTQALWVEACSREGLSGCGEGCPREYVSAEDMASALAFVDTHRAEWLHRLTDAEALAQWVGARSAEIDVHPAAWTAVELACLDLFGKARGAPVDALLGLPELAGRFQYTAVLGDAAPERFEAQLQAYLRAGFTQFKVKLSGDLARDAGRARALTGAGLGPAALRADANNLWRSPQEAICHIAAMGNPFFALEEPLRPGDAEGLRRVASALGVAIILDESVLRVGHLAPFCRDPARWIVNLRVSKMGGLLRSLAMVHEARRRGLRLIVGAHVGETSVLTRAALTVAHSARDLLVGQEGAFGTHLLAADVASPPLMFGPAGMLDWAGTGWAGRPGLGLVVDGAG